MPGLLCAITSRATVYSREPIDLNPQFNPHIVAASAAGMTSPGVLYLRPSSGINPNIAYAENPGTGWVVTEFPLPNGTSPGDYGLAIGPSGVVHIVYAHLGIVYIKRVSGVWSSPITIPNTGGGGRISIALDPVTARPHVTYVRGPAFPGDSDRLMHMYQIDDNTWSPEQLVYANGSVVLEAQSNLFFVGNNPAIAFEVSFTGGAHEIRWSVWNPAFSVFDDNTVLAMAGGSLSAALNPVSGEPVIAFQYNSDYGGLDKAVIAEAVHGPFGWTYVPVDSAYSAPYGDISSVNMAMDASGRDHVVYTKGLDPQLAGRLTWEVRHAVGVARELVWQLPPDWSQKPTSTLTINADSQSPEIVYLVDRVPASGLEETILYLARPGSNVAVEARGGYDGPVTVTPNPTRSSIEARFAPINVSKWVQVSVVDVDGRRVRELFKGERPAAAWTIQWNGQDENGAAVPAGVYFVTMRGNGESVTKRVVMLR
ncbi:MAG TPA: T9SS type A sorting domain-containing protein [Gemmataceae bacterium]|nr:T9SS type A sorting domain-containing protein [Gemmataceae bacterium]